MEEYYDEGQKYSNDYFRGRIAEATRAEAEITLEFYIGGSLYRVKRGLFEPAELREFSVTRPDDQVPEDEDTELTRRERQRRYETLLVADTGLTTFAEFVFLQLFVFTFDERRVTLFWNQRILERALFITFGLDPGMARKVDSLRREYESADSQFRNRQYDMTRTRKFMAQLKSQSLSASTNQENYDQLAKEHETLVASLEIASLKLEEIVNQYKDATRRLETLSARASAYRDEYDQYFQEGFEGRLPLAQHPLITKSLSEHTCGLCGSAGNDVVQTLRTKASSSNCLLCDSLLQQIEPQEDNSSKLLELDKELSSAKHDVRNFLYELDRLRNEESEARAG